MMIISGSRGGNAAPGESWQTLPAGAAWYPAGTAWYPAGAAWYPAGAA